MIRRLAAAALGATLLAATTAAAAPGAAADREAACLNLSNLSLEIMVHRQDGTPRAQLDALVRGLSPGMRPPLNQMIEAAWREPRHEDPEGRADMADHFSGRVYRACMGG